MQRLIVTLFIVMFVAFGVFGLSFMTHQSDTMSHDGCLAGGAFGSVCPQGIGSLSMIDLHFDALSYFSSATFSDLQVIAIMALFSVLAGLLFARLRIDVSAHAVAIILRTRKCFALACAAAYRQLASWLVVHTRKNPSPVCVFNF